MGGKRNVGQQLMLEKFFSVVQRRAREFLADIGQPNIAFLDFRQPQHLQCLGDRKQVVHFHVKRACNDGKVGLSIVWRAGDRLDQTGQQIGGDPGQHRVGPNLRKAFCQGCSARRRGRTLRHGDVDSLDKITEPGIKAVARLRQVNFDLADDLRRIGRENEDAVAHQYRFFDIVRHQDDPFDGEPAFAPEIEKVRPQSFRGEDVERRERFIHQQNIGVNDESACETDPLAHAARQLAWIGRLVAIQANQVDRGKGTLANLGLGKAERLQSELNIFQHGEPGKKREGLKHHRNARRRRNDRLAEIRDTSCGRACEPGDQAKQGRFARSRAAKKADDLPRRKLHVDVVENEQLITVRLWKGLAYGMEFQQGSLAHHRLHFYPSRNFRSAYRYNGRQNVLLITTTNKLITAIPSTIRWKSPASVARAIYAPRP